MGLNGRALLPAGTAQRWKMGSSTRASEEEPDLWSANSKSRTSFEHSDAANQTKQAHGRLGHHGPSPVCPPADVIAWRREKMKQHSIIARRSSGKISTKRAYPSIRLSRRRGFMPSPEGFYVDRGPRHRISSVHAITVMAARTASAL
ncbi:hypothetical protein BP5796_04394 [Coleophoma crateriformis]|uniref:Uncharacterized protein n=1 Tax=Coleophoma crateriformis TaxID=565419 RepID=A0A3D8S9E7_9HELO|nr:hypothetical protein BP5796_04394 [Coleophoma crateriformis]